MNTYVVVRRGGWSDPVELEKAASRSSRVLLEGMAGRVRWIRSYVLRETDGRLGIICIYQGDDSVAVREHARQADLPCDEVIPVDRTVVINDDPRDGA